MKKILSAIIVMLIIGVGIHFSIRSGLLINQFKELITAKLAESLDKEVSIEKIEGGFGNKVILRNVQIKDKTPQSSEIITIEKVTINYNLWDILFKKVKVIESIDKITLHKPWFFIKEIPKKQFTYRTLSTLKIPVINTKIVLEEGQLLVKSNAQSLNAELKNICGWLDFSFPSQIKINLSARSKESAQSNVALRGKINLKTNYFALNLMVKKGSLAYYSHYVFPQEVTFLGGDFNLNLHFSDYIYSGKAEVKKGIFKVKSSDLIFKNLDCNLKIDKGKSGGKFSFKGKGKSKGEFSFVKGKLKVIFQNERLPYRFIGEVNIKKRPFNLTLIGYNLLNQKKIKLMTKFTFAEKTIKVLSLTVNDNYHFAGNIKIEDDYRIILDQFKMGVKGRNFAKIQADIEYGEKKLKIHSFNCQDNYNFSAEIDFRKKPTVKGQLRFKEAKISDIFPKMKGEMEGTIELSGLLFKPQFNGSLFISNGDLKGVDMGGRFNVRGFSNVEEGNLSLFTYLDSETLSLNHKNFEKVNIEITWQKGVWEISAFSQENNFTVKAKIDKSKKPSFLNLNVNLKEVELSTLGKLVGFEIPTDFLKGSLTAEVISQGQLGNLFTKGNLKIEQGKLNLNFNIENKTIIITKLEMKGERNLLAKNLQIKIKEGKIIVESSEEEEIKVDLPGFLEGDLFIKLAFSKIKGIPQIEGRVSFKNTSFTYPPKIKRGKVKYSYRKPVIWNVKLVVGKNVRYYNNYVDLEIRKGEGLHFHGQGKDGKIKGGLECERGTIVYLGTEFEIKEASLRFKGLEGRKGFLNGRAETRREKTKITLALKGELGKLEPSLTSEPPLSKQEVVALLKWGQEYSGLKGRDTGELAFRGIARLLETGLQTGLVDPLERKLRKYLNLSVFKIETGIIESLYAQSKSNSQEEKDDFLPTTRFTLGKYIAEDLYLVYEMILNSERERKLALNQGIGLEYMLENGEVIKYEVKTTEEGEEEYKVGIEKKVRF